MLPYKSAGIFLTVCICDWIDVCRKAPSSSIATVTSSKYFSRVLNFGIIHDCINDFGFAEHSGDSRQSLPRIWTNLRCAFAEQTRVAIEVENDVSLLEMSCISTCRAFCVFGFGASRNISRLVSCCMYSTVSRRRWMNDEDASIDSS